MDDVEKLERSRKEWMQISFRQHDAVVKGKVAVEKLEASESIACGFAFALGMALEGEAFYEEPSIHKYLAVYVSDIEKAVTP